MSVSPRVAVFGATGFVGRATTAAIAVRGAEVVPIRAPRLPDMPASAASTFVRDHQDIVADLAKSIAEVSVVVNAAGDPGASS
ncbi:MAG TPA: NAD-dependent epimerase/dehydratase family protein, partial [Kribbella sp.]